MSKDLDAFAKEAENPDARALAFLTPGAQKLLRNNSKDVEMLSNDGKWIQLFNKLQEGRVYRLRPDLKPEIRPPYGYRIVGIEERQKKAYPTDGPVMWCLRGGPWLYSMTYNGWDIPEYIFAVPDGYVFAEDRPKERWFFNPYACWVVNAGQDGTRTYESAVNYIEITEDWAKYYQTNPEPVEGFEWVLKVPEKGDVFLSLDRETLTESRDGHHQRIRQGVRWTQVPVKIESRTETLIKSAIVLLKEALK